MWYLLVNAHDWLKLPKKTQDAIRHCMSIPNTVRALRERMLIFQSRHDEKGSYDVMTFNNPGFGWQRTVRPNGNVVKWREVRLFWEDEDADFNRTWLSDSDDDNDTW